ncbi:hypothetical protein IT570_06610 [Candidatus Sumerlaeota bacterium]|nr:hypothetical protein [Candidatus Sumerlaeota bacterium]
MMKILCAECAAAQSMGGMTMASAQRSVGNGKATARGLLVAMKSQKWNKA